MSETRLLSLDAGNTIIFLDHARVARFVGSLGADVTTDALVRAEGVAKRALLDGSYVDDDWAHKRQPGAIGWGRVTSTMLAAAGVPRAQIPTLVAALWEDHVRLNLWSLVPPDLAAGVERVRALGVKVVVVSNSEGMLASLFEELGILPLFDAIIDSALVGVEKPDPRIFEAALAPYGVAPHEALHLGDTYATDIVGAKNAGLRYALIDPYAHYEGMYEDVPRVESVAAVCASIAGS